MKKLLIAAIAGVWTCAAAETFNVASRGIAYVFPVEEVDTMQFVNEGELKILGHAFRLLDVDSMYVANTMIKPGEVVVNYSEGQAQVFASGSLAGYLGADISGGHVKLTQSESVSDNTSGEITYTLSGSASDGEFELTGSYKCTIEFAGLTLTNPVGAAVGLQNGKRIKLHIADGTHNELADGREGSQKGCLTTKGHLEIKGKGELDITGNLAHAIHAKEYVTMKNATIRVRGAEKDGLNCGQYFAMESGTLMMENLGDDGLQVSFKDDADRSANDTGAITVSGGTLDITASAGGRWDSEAGKTKSAACVKSDGVTAVSGGTLRLVATGSGGKGIKSGSQFKLSGGNIEISTSGGLFAYRNGVTYDNYTGNTDNLNSQYKSSPKGVKADGEIMISAGAIDVTTTGNGGEGIESKSTLTISGGTVTVHANDDGINSAGDMHLSGGDITSISTTNDGIDSNGNLYVEGGMIMAFGASAPECGLDANEEGGYSVFITGGKVLAVGGGNSVPSSSQSTQCYVSGNMSLTAGQLVELKEGNTVLASFTIPAGYSAAGNRVRAMAPPPPPMPAPGFGFGPGGPGGMSHGGGVLITCGGLTSGKSYTLSYGTATASVTAVQYGSSSGGRPGW